jgi:membrane protease YdiL (CAAX protease family)
MMVTRENITRRSAFGKSLLQWSLKKPVMVCVILFLIALVIRWIDSFVLRMDERVGELIITKSLGFILVLVFIWLTGRKVKDIGLHRRSLPHSLLIGILTTLIAFCVGYGAEMLLAFVQGNQPLLHIEIIDSKMGVTGGLWFALWMLMSNAINSFMEEGLFRGLMGRLSRIRFSLWGANWFQAAFFSIWHLPWVLKYFLVGEINSSSELAMTIFYHSIPQLLIGLVYGYFFLKTGNLWSAWIAHVLNNTILNYLHITTTSGLDAGFPIRMSVYTVMMLISLLWVKRLSERSSLQGAEPWA